MKKDKLLSVIEEINNWCKKNNIICFKGFAEEGFSEEDFLLPYYNYDKESNDEWIDFLEIAKKLKVNIIVIAKAINTIKTLYRDEFEIILENENLSSFLKKKYENAIEHDNEIAQIKLTFNYDDICYRFIINSEWYSDYQLALAEIENTDDIESSSNDDHNNSQEIYQKRLSEIKIEEYSRKIISHEDFIINANSRNNRENYSKKVLKEILGDEYIDSYYIYFPVFRSVEALFETEIKPKIELEIKNKVLELKKQGFKKVEIHSKLDISRSMVDRFFNME
jgi:hypothetical protein